MITGEALNALLEIVIQHIGNENFNDWLNDIDTKEDQDND